MNLYVETSAVVAWLFGEARGAEASRILQRSRRVFTSELTLVECDRATISAMTMGRVAPEVAEAARRRLALESVSRDAYALTSEVLLRARQAFPVEPVRTLDAFHLATALQFRVIRPDLSVLSFDRRVRENAVALGFEVMPGEA